jgi:hypothetical protein
MKFDWDARKAAANRRKHGVSLEEASSVFFDPFAITVPDIEHSTERERRERTTGISTRLRVLVVVHVERIDDVIRIISARKASKAETHDHEEEVQKRIAEGQG